MGARQRIQTYYGYAFESWCTSDTPPSSLQPGTHEHASPSHPGGDVSPPGWGGDVDTNVQWCSVVKTKLGDTRMVIGGEVDCVKGELVLTVILSSWSWIAVSYVWGLDFGI